MTLRAEWSFSKKKGEKMIVLKTSDRKGASLRAVVEEEAEKVEKVGKKKNWIGGKEGGVGFKVEVL